MFQIGQFSKIAQVPVTRLRYYAEVGLLEPAHIDEWSGYRYYTVEQLPKLNRILALRALGLSLKQIREMINDDVSADQIRGMLALRKAQIEQLVEEETARLRMVEARIGQLDSEADYANADIVIKSVPAHTAFLLKMKVPQLSVAFTLVDEMIHVLPKKIGPERLGFLTALFHADEYRETDIDMSFGFVLKKPWNEPVELSNGGVMTTQQVPASAETATVIRYGGPENNHLSFGAAGVWAQVNGYTIVAPMREVVIKPPDHSDSAEIVTEMQFPLVKNPS